MNKPSDERAWLILSYMEEQREEYEDYTREDDYEATGINEIDDDWIYDNY